jgi:UDP-glucuronate 4-epimerase
MSANVLVTGAAGFIGFHTSKRLIQEGYQVTGLDNLNDYYDPKIKEDRLKLLLNEAAFKFHKLDLADQKGMDALFKNGRFDYVVHLAAQAGVRYSIENPRAYLGSNIDGTLNVLEGCRHHPVKHLVFASTSSVYGLNTKLPFSVSDKTDTPISLYAATKKANELMAHSYSHLFSVPSTGLRFFTVYGPWGRPDMALFKFAKGILEGKEIEVYNNGKMSRDFTYVDDIVEALFRTIKLPPTDKPPFRIFNIGQGNPVNLMDFIRAIESHAGKKAKLKNLPMQPGDVPATSAEVENLELITGFKPKTQVQEGIKRFMSWYRDYYAV